MYGCLGFGGCLLMSYKTPVCLSVYPEAFLPAADGIGCQLLKLNWFCLFCQLNRIVGFTCWTENRNLLSWTQNGVIIYNEVSHFSALYTCFKVSKKIVLTRGLRKRKKVNLKRVKV